MSDDDVATYMRPHLVLDEDCWYSCSQGDTCDDTRKGMPCDCGADRTNAVLTALRSQNRALQEEVARISWMQGEVAILRERADELEKGLRWLLVQLDDIERTSVIRESNVYYFATQLLSPTQETDPE